MAIEPMYTPEQLAEILQIPVSRLYKWRGRNEGPKFIKVGHSLRYKESDVQAWLDGETVDPQELSEAS